MRTFLLLLTAILAIDGTAQFQLPNPALNNVHTTMPGTFRGYGMDPLRGIYTIYFDDGKHYSGSGSMKKDGDKQVLKVKDLNGNKRIQKAQGTVRLIFEPEGTGMFNKNRVIYQFVTVGNLYWMASAGGSIPELYYAIQQPNVAAIRKGNNIEFASLEDILKIIGNHKKAQKFARNGDYDRAFAEFNGTSTSMYRSGKKGRPVEKEEE
ncbi:hypothetical protein ACTJIJ_02730 [Niabella sp. 22666]|jgi:hypothetical protein|uniref:hypothetical protein n=1 Tax=Niabella sp. 22666 TaxID=3453954 RepID=UPI003F851D92